MAGDLREIPLNPLNASGPNFIILFLIDPLLIKGVLKSVDFYQILVFLIKEQFQLLAFL